MRYIKSSGGYYYKEYSNGKRVRISEDDYNNKRTKIDKKNIKSHINKSKIDPNINNKIVQDGGITTSDVKSGIVKSSVAVPIITKKSGEKMLTKSKIAKNYITDTVIPGVREDYKEMDKLIDSTIFKKSNEIIYLGDLIDSSCKPTLKLCNNYENIGRFSFNLRNIAFFNKKEKFTLYLGNRDLNKVKLFRLLELDIDKVEEYTKIPDSITSYFDRVNSIKDSIISNTKNYDFEKSFLFNNKYLDRNNWGYLKPLWNKNNKNNNNNVKFQNRWEGNDNIIKSYEHYFDSIFGPDPGTGTMSAEFLLHTIYNEYTNSDIIPKSWKKILTKEINLEVKALIVLSVFHLIMIDPISIDAYYKNEKDFIKKYSLVKLLKNNNVKFFECKQNNDVNDNNIYCFSHAGIGSKILNDKAIEQLTEIDLPLPQDQEGKGKREEEKGKGGEGGEADKEKNLLNFQHYYIYLMK